ncbi:MAG TPA: CDP-alcohol phosphatidyltransferase family protein [Persephonella sp.]|uniref:CDP-alcohol phosphatidyltransferase n=1 Tax=Persephonella marina (strain DSM 14350 / EX-H1) TaxID=123214 RepID=C0QUC5_PERMH|nr:MULTISPECIES: CDP-alcohol phosphatidyltransferase family protein [Persephonella]ACO03305.1 CDP-alcohol phosphatidyltransferase [Persephonella marina EX-H1]HCB70091.1 CDP-alcohol phosphatidyltransferase family protein [Persephonella sp.]
MSQIIKQIKPVFEEKISPVVDLLHRINISPNVVTFSGLLFIIAGSYFLFLQEYITAGFLILAGNLCDALDGALARKHKKITRFGAFIDSVVDRLSDFFPLMAIALIFSENTLFLSVTLLAIMFSYMVSYTRARAEGLGIDCKVGIFERAERSIVLIIAVFTGYLEIAVSIIAVGSAVTALQRVICFYKKSL